MMHPVDYAPNQDFGDNPTRDLPASSWIIQQFGNYQPDGHTGIDYPCPIGTPVKAAAAGLVLHVGRLSGTYATNPWWIAPPFAGFVYVVDHGHFIGIYGHCQDGGARVVVNQRVKEGQVLGLSGNTGASTGPHLHFEILPDGYVLNSRMYGRIDPASLFGSIQFQSGTTTTIPIQEDSLANFEEADIERIVKKAIDGWSKDYRTFAGNRNQLDTFAQTQAEHEAILAAINAIPASILFENRVDGRNIVDTGRQGLANDAVVLATLSGLSAGSTVTAADIAAAIPEDIAQQVVDALAARLVK